MWKLYISLAVVFLFKDLAQGQIGLPEQFTHTMTYNSESLTIDFKRYSNRSSKFKLFVQQVDGSFLETSANTYQTYYGTAREDHGSVAAALRRSDGSLLATVILSDFTQWNEHLGRVTKSNYVPTFTMPNYTNNFDIDSETYGADVLFDIPYQQYLACGGTVSSALEMTEYSMMCTNIIFLRDANVTNLIGHVYVRPHATLDPYESEEEVNVFYGYDILYKEHSDFLKNTSENSHNLASVSSPKLVGGGLANVSTVAFPSDGRNSNSAKENGDFSNVGRHEFGHNWGVKHWEGGTAEASPEGWTIVSGNALGKLSSPAIKKVLYTKTQGKPLLQNLGRPLIELPPRANDDVIYKEVEREASDYSPLVNDFDANRDFIALNSITADVETDPNITISSDTQNVMIPPFEGSTSGLHSYLYEIIDENGQTSQARLYINAYMDGQHLIKYDFESEDKAIDSSSRGNHGQLVDNAMIKDGTLTLDGTGDKCVIKNLPIKGNEFTFSAWVYRDGSQVGGSSIIMGREKFSLRGTGLSFGFNNELQYHWNENDWQFNPNFVIPDKTWCFVAVVIDPEKATLYLDDGSGLRSSVHEEANEEKDHFHPFEIGNDPGFDRHFKGAFDTVRVIEKSLNQRDIELLRNKGYGASIPSPENLSESRPGRKRLTWKTNPESINSQRLFFSNNYLAVRNGVIGDTSDLGELPSNTQHHDLPTLDAGTYYWRVDTENDTSTVKGDIWAFRINPLIEVSPALEHWKLNEISGTTISGIAAQHQGALSIGREQLGASSYTALAHKCLTCDGSTGYVEIPYSEQLNRPEFTVNLWAKPGEITTKYQSLICSRDLSSSLATGYTLFLQPENYWSFWYGNGTTFETLNSPKTYPSDQWYNLTFSLGPELAKLYVDGALVHSKSIERYVSNTSRPLRIGAGKTETTTQEYFLGLIDDVQYWDRELSVEEVRSLSDYWNWLKEEKTQESDQNFINFCFGLSSKQSSLPKEWINSQDHIISLPWNLDKRYRYTLLQSYNFSSWEPILVREKSSENWRPRVFSLSPTEPASSDLSSFRFFPHPSKKAFWKIVVD